MIFEPYYNSSELARSAAINRGYALFETQSRQIFAVREGELLVLAEHQTGYADWRAIKRIA